MLLGRTRVQVGGEAQRCSLFKMTPPRIIIIKNKVNLINLIRKKYKKKIDFALYFK